ncbi:hypothetical protein AAD018_001235 [Aestuariibius insulae]|uniref:hypothetical protein n=1 Tax=Aestuariibius insulae TaxID=2058287 RepID=UPI00398E977D
MDGTGTQSADLGQVLDRTEFAINEYQGYLADNGIEEVGQENLDEFTGFMVTMMNVDPRFYDETLGVDLMQDATFLGYADTNANGVKDAGEDKVFTVEIDEENQRLIATDVAGNSSGLRFSATGFLAGALIGNLISRQRSAGVSKASFNNRNVTPRSSYRPPSSARTRARSGGVGVGK